MAWGIVGISTINNVNNDMHPTDIADVTPIRHDWQLAEVSALFSLSINELIFNAQTVHRQHFDPNQVQLSSLLNIKTGKCSEDCGYCAQSARFNTHVTSEALLDPQTVQIAAQQAKDQGATRFCMGAAWRSPKSKDFDQILEIVQRVKSVGMEACMTLGMLSDTQAQQLQQAGLDYYNHNLDTSPEYYQAIVSTHDYQDRLNTLATVHRAGIKVCCGGIIGMGETRQDRVKFLLTLANLPNHPDSVPINQFIPIPGTPLADVQPIDVFEIIRCIAVARILMPASYVRLAAGRTEMNDALQALCFLAGANSVFYGDRLLTTDNPTAAQDMQLFNRLGLHIA
jgi:biotin synthase